MTATNATPSTASAASTDASAAPALKDAVSSTAPDADALVSADKPLEPPLCRNSGGKGG